MVDELGIEVVYHHPSHLFRAVVPLRTGLTVAQALDESGIFSSCPELSGKADKVGVFGQLVEPGQVLQKGDRVEVYRPLIFDPKEARRQRAKLSREAK